MILYVDGSKIELYILYAILYPDDSNLCRVRPELQKNLATGCSYGDITYIATGEGWLHLAAVLDLHSQPSGRL